VLRSATCKYVYLYFEGHGYNLILASESAFRLYHVIRLQATISHLIFDRAPSIEMTFSRYADPTIIPLRCLVLRFGLSTVFPVSTLSQWLDEHNSVVSAASLLANESSFGGATRTSTDEAVFSSGVDHTYLLSSPEGASSSGTPPKQLRYYFQNFH